VDALTRAGRLDDARSTLEKPPTYGNHVRPALRGDRGHPRADRQLPQAFTHLVLIDAAVTLDAALDGVRPADRRASRLVRSG
jgi:hypothetical protein